MLKNTRKIFSFDVEGFIAFLRSFHNGESIDGPQWAGCYGLHWALLALLSFHIWSERNKRLRQHSTQTERPPEQILKAIVKDIGNFFNVTSFKKSNHTLVEINVQKTWEANILSQHPISRRAV